MSYTTPRSNKARILQLLDDDSSRLNRKLTTSEIETKFDAAFILTDIEVSLLGRWSAIAYIPQKGSGNDKWGYKVFNRDGLQDCGLINLIYLSNIDMLSPQLQRQVVNLITDIAQCKRDWGYVPPTYGITLMSVNTP